MVSTIISKLTNTHSIKPSEITLQKQNTSHVKTFRLKPNSKSALALAAFLNPLCPTASVDTPLKGQAFYTCLGCKIAHLRKEKGWYQKELSEKTGISTSYISRLERGYRIEGVTLDILLKVAEVFDIAISELFTYSPDEIKLAHYREELHKYC